MIDILALLIEERDKIQRAIDAFTVGTAPKKRGRPAKNALANAPDWVTSKNPLKKATEAAPAPAKKKRNFSPAQRKAAAERMKRMWAKKKAAAKKAAA